MRTRQGLSGHIQFRHKAGQASSLADPSELFSKAQHLKSLSNAAKLPTAETERQALIVIRWATVTRVLHLLGVKVNNQDFKNYLILSLACMYENEEFKERLASRLKNLLEEYK